jgi:hypothetical protein
MRHLDPPPQRPCSPAKPAIGLLAAPLRGTVGARGAPRRSAAPRPLHSPGRTCRGSSLLSIAGRPGRQSPGRLASAPVGLLNWLSQVMRLGACGVRAARDGCMCVAHAACMCCCSCYVYVYVLVGSGGTVCFIGIKCVRVCRPVRVNGALTEDPPRPH